MEAHPTYVQEYNRAYYLRNREAVKAKTAQWAKENVEAVRVIARRKAQNRRARKLDQFIEDVDPMVVYARDEGLCGICGTTIYGDFHVDHVIPLSKGGEHSYANTQAAHPECNLRKAART